jgi:two-component system response regulator NreC
MATIVVADDHNMIRQGLRALLSAQPDFEVVGEAGDGVEAVREAERLQPDVLVLDMIMPGFSGIEVIRRLNKRPLACAIVVLSMYGADGYVKEAIKSGAKGYILKKDSVEELTSAIREVLAGRHYISPSLTRKVIDSYAGINQKRDPYDTLTAREREVLHMVAAGNTSTQISVKLFISRRTVEFHRANMMNKLRLRSQQALARYCLEAGISPCG